MDGEARDIDTRIFRASIVIQHETRLIFVFLP
jgi:hypothetical protein